MSTFLFLSISKLINAKSKYSSVYCRQEYGREGEIALAGRPPPSGRHQDIDSGDDEPATKHEHQQSSPSNDPVKRTV
jgi:hypothetical protein